MKTHESEFDKHQRIEQSKFVARLEASEDLLATVRRQLNQWASESVEGGWSTHQVEPQRKLAARIQQFLDS